LKTKLSFCQEISGTVWLIISVSLTSVFGV